MKKLKEKVSLYIVKAPARAILLGILLLNIALFFGSAALINYLSPNTHGNAGFWQSVFYTISMILDAGCIQYVVEDIGQTGVILIIVCTLTVLLGMITFTGAVIGYITNGISNFIDNANFGKNAIKVSGHTIILNWNSRASEIINDLLFSSKNEVVIVLVDEDSDAVKLEIEDRIAATIKNENRKLERECRGRGPLYRYIYLKKHSIKNKLTYIVREGDTFSSKQLNDISISQAKTVIIMDKEIQNNTCRYDIHEAMEMREKGNSDTIKTLVQVSEFTSAADSADDQVIIVEIKNDWTENLVNKIIAHKEKSGKCNIIPVPVNRILGQVLSQFSIMPELNKVYSELFSHKGVEFFCETCEHGIDDNEYIEEYFDNHSCAIPLTTFETKTGNHMFYIAEEDKDVRKLSKTSHKTLQLKVNTDYWLSKRNVIILGHNSRMEDIMKGFSAFSGEWDIRHEDGTVDNILNIIVIDDEDNLKKHAYYRDYPYVNGCIAAGIYDDKKILENIDRIIDENKGDTSVLILSDDLVVTEDVDAKALTYLIYIQDLISGRIANNPDFNTNSIDVVIEILNPKNYDVVQSYSETNVVISNRYISRMITQIGDKEALYDFYRDILTYDEEDAEEYESKELYIKEADRFLVNMPDVLRCTVAELIRTIYDNSPVNNRTIVIGFVNSKGITTLFSGNQETKNIEIAKSDKLIVFSNH